MHIGIQLFTLGEDRVDSLQLIEELLQERQEIAALLQRLADRVLQKQTTHPTELLGRLCHHLVHYVEQAERHIYRHILNGAEDRRQVAAITRQLYPRIAETSQLSRAFNRKYAIGPPTSVVELWGDLAHLGEELATRSELEGRIWAELAREDGATKEAADPLLTRNQRSPTLA